MLLWTHDDVAVSGCCIRRRQAIDRGADRATSFAQRWTIDPASVIKPFIGWELRLRHGSWALSPDRIRSARLHANEITVGPVYREARVASVVHHQRVGAQL